MNEQKFTLRLDPKHYEQLRKIAFDTRISMNVLINAAIGEWLQRVNKKEDN